MSESLLNTLQRRFAAAAELLPAAMPAIESDDPVAFLIRYRVDALAGIPEQTFRRLRSAAREERDLDRRRASARRALEKAGKLTEALAARLDETRDATWIEDMVRGLRAENTAKDPMTDVARKVLAGESSEPVEELLKPFCGADGAHPTAADQRSRLVALVANLLADDADLRAAVRTEVRRSGTVATSVSPEHAGSDVWASLTDTTHPIGEMKQRELFLLRRGQKLGAVRVKTDLPEEVRTGLLTGPLATREGHPYAELVAEAAKESLDRHLVGAAGAAVLTDRRRQATRTMLPRMMRTLYERLMAPPAGAVPVVVAAPGTQGSCRLLVVDADGRPGRTEAVHPANEAERENAAKMLAELVRESGAGIVVVPSGRRARGARIFAESTLAADREIGAAPVVVNEQPAADWAESEAARTESPELAASARVALSMGRAVQDPLVEASRWDLTELSIDPIQRDLDQGELKAAFDEVIEECVAEIGVDVNTAPLPLLLRVPGLAAGTARAIVAARANVTFASRTALREVEGMSEEQWQRAGGFLRVRDAVDPLDATGVHPTGLDIVAAIAAAKNVEPSDLVGAPELLEDVDPTQFAGEVHTVHDVESVLRELRIGRGDPRTAFVAPAFNPGVQRLQDLTAGMEMEGVVASLQSFGAFVDLGVRQHGLVHVSEIAHDFIQDPATVLTVGQKVQVKVLGVDIEKRRISLSMKALLPAPERPARAADDGDRGGPRRFGDAQPAGPGGAMAPGAAAARGGDRGRRSDGGPPRRGGRDDRTPSFDAVIGPGGAKFERPGTPPRRAGGGRGGFRRDGDRRSQDMFSLARDRDDRGGKGGSADEGGEEGARHKPIPKPVDPFLAQIQMLKAKLSGHPVPAPAPVETAAPESSDGPMNRKARRAMLAAQRAAQGLPPIASESADAGPSPAESTPSPVEAAPISAESAVAAEPAATAAEPAPAAAESAPSVAEPVPQLADEPRITEPAADADRPT